MSHTEDFKDPRKVDPGNTLVAQSEYRPVPNPTYFCGSEAIKVGVTATRVRVSVCEPVDATTILSANMDGPARVEVVSTPAGLALGGLRALERARQLLSSELTRIGDHTGADLQLEEVGVHSEERPESRRLKIRWKTRFDRKPFITGVSLVEAFRRVLGQIAVEQFKASWPVEAQQPNVAE